jgi:hypothetical protein
MKNTSAIYSVLPLKGDEPGRSSSLIPGIRAASFSYSYPLAVGMGVALSLVRISPAVEGRRAM